MLRHFTITLDMNVAKIQDFSAISVIIELRENIALKITLEESIV